MTDEQWQKAKILIVDDKPANVMLLEQIVQQKGYRHIRTTTDPRQTESIYLEFQPDLILLDLQMPHMDGFQVMARLHEISQENYIPIIVLTAQTDQPIRLKALNSGAKDFLTKPFDINEIQQRISNILEIRLLHNQVLEQNRDLEDNIRERTQQLEDTRLEVVERLGRAAEYRDNETGMHVVRISRFSQCMAKALGWDDQQCRLILHSSPMHDIGKIGIPDRILLKPGKLDHDEWKIMKTHSEIGGEILAGSETDVMKMAERIANGHHEKWDGTGYPKGLKGDEIPVEAQIVTLVDVFDALTTEHPYKKAWPVEEALTFIKENNGIMFNPHLVETFMRILPEILELKERYGESMAEARGIPKFSAS